MSFPPLCSIPQAVQTNLAVNSTVMTVTPQHSSAWSQVNTNSEKLTHMFEKATKSEHNAQVVHQATV